MSICTMVLTVEPRKIVEIDGKTYDVTDFNHPGGQQMLDSVIGSEFATEVFQTYHSSTSRANTILKKMEVNNSKSKDQVSFFPMDSETYIDLEKLVLQFRNKSNKYMTFWWFITNGILFIAGMDSFIKGKIFFAIPLLIMFKVHMGFTLYHYLHHGGLYKQFPGLSKYLEIFLNISTYHGQDWKRAHNLLHHVSVNNPTVDEDIFSGMPYIRLHNSQSYFWYHRYQHIYIFFLFALYGLIVVFKGKSERMIYPLLDIIIYCIFPGLINKKLLYSVIAYLTIKVLSGVIFITIFSLSHNSIDLVNDIEFTNLKSNCWAKNQITQSVNWGGQLMCFLLGGINYQIEHHLFPNIHPMHYPKIAEIVAGYCKKKSIKYIHYKGFLSALIATLKYIKLMGTKV